MKKYLTKDNAVFAFLCCVVLGGGLEFLRFYFLNYSKNPNPAPEYGMKLLSFFANLLYGLGIGALCFYYESKKEGNWRLSFRRLLLVFLPVFAVSLLQLNHNPQMQVSAGLYKSGWTYDVDFHSLFFRINLPYLFTGLALPLLFEKKPVGKAKRLGFIKEIFFPLILIPLVFFLNGMLRSLIRHASATPSVPYIRYECLEWAGYLLFGVLLGLFVFLCVRPAFSGRRYLLIACLPALALGILFYFIPPVYRQFLQSGYFHVYYTFPLDVTLTDFCKLSDFIRLFPLLTGFFLVPGVAGAAKSR